MKEKMKNKNGITLIALVITIIVLLILAIVTIRLIVDGGIINHAKNGTAAYHTAEDNELAQISDAEAKMENLTSETTDSTAEDKYEGNKYEEDTTEKWDCEVNGHYWCNNTKAHSYSDGLICKYCYKTSMGTSGGEDHHDENFSAP